MAGTLLQRSMSQLMTEVKGRAAGQIGQKPSSSRAPQAAQEQEFDDVPAAGARQEGELMEDEERARQFQEEDHREFDEEVRIMDVDSARRSERAPEQAGAVLAPQSVADIEAAPMDNAPSTAPGAFQLNVFRALRSPLQQHITFGDTLPAHGMVAPGSARRLLP